MRFKLMRFLTARSASLLLCMLFSSSLSGQVPSNDAATAPDPAQPRGSISGAAPGSGLGVPRTTKIFTGIAKPLPGEQRLTPEQAVKPNGPIPGTAVHKVNSYYWLRPSMYPYGYGYGYGCGYGCGSGCGCNSGCGINGPLNQEPALPQGGKCGVSETGGVIETSPILQMGGNAQNGKGTIPVPTLAPPNPDSGLKAPTLLGPKEAGSAHPTAANAPEDWGNFFGPHPRPEKTFPVGLDPDAPRIDHIFPNPVGPPRPLQYGGVFDSRILNAPYAPAEALPKVWSNGREVTATERSHWAEGRAPIIRRRLVMARHTNVATSLPQFCDGLEHCPVCCRAYLCGCGEEECRFCNPDARIGPAPVCECCGEKRPCIHGNMCKGQLGHAPYREWGNTSGGIACPICKLAVESVPCGCCEKCLKGETCENYKPCGKCPSCLIFEKCDLYRAHRNCVLPAKTNSCNRCDNTINGEPCGTCDWCRENSGNNHEPCGHQEVGLLNAKTVYNPYNEPKLFSAPPRFITDRFNNRASKFPIYYNPAPYYKEMSNPSTWGAFQRPFTHRWTCDLCRNEPCTCAAAGHAGQVAYAFACKFCNRTPCACAAEICNANMPLNPQQVRAQLDQLEEESKPKLPDEQQGSSEGGFVPTVPIPSAPQQPAEPNMWSVPPPPPSLDDSSILPPGNDFETQGPPPEAAGVLEENNSVRGSTATFPGSGAKPLGGEGRMLGDDPLPSDSTIAPGTRGRVLGDEMPPLSSERSVVPGAKAVPLDQGAPLGSGGRELRPGWTPPPPPQNQSLPPQGQPVQASPKSKTSKLFTDFAPM